MSPAISQRLFGHLQRLDADDARQFLPLAAEVPIRPRVQEFALEQANEALKRVKAGKTQGAAVLRLPDPDA